MALSTDSYTGVAGQARQATQRSAEAFKTTTRSIIDQLDAFKLPTVDLTTPVARYFDSLQKVVDVNRDLATQWAELVTTMSGTVRGQAQQIAGIVKDQTSTVADLATEQAEKVEQAAKQQADQVERAERERAEAAEEAEKAKAREAKRVEREEAKKAQQQADEAEEAEKAKAREAKRVEREEAKQAAEQARQAYEGLTKAELSDQLAERGLPKTGNLDELVERLVSADSK